MVTLFIICHDNDYNQGRQRDAKGRQAILLAHTDGMEWNGNTIIRFWKKRIFILQDPRGDRLGMLTEQFEILRFGMISKVR
mmetsp:Transcript_8062/g.17366  ORF Transcript_8062/g.17366 Transcript_8062/m.17366 type:complete len:81 (+) Transcript_8062:2173-2415(+)